MNQDSFTHAGSWYLLRGCFFFVVKNWVAVYFLLIVDFTKCNLSWYSFGNPFTEGQPPRFCFAHPLFFMLACFTDSWRVWTSYVWGEANYDAIVVWDFTLRFGAVVPRCPIPPPPSLISLSFFKFFVSISMYFS
jgi:hypothetical protein